MSATNGHANGTAPPADPQAVRQQLRDTRAKLRLIETQAQLRNAEQRHKLLESLWLGRDDWWGSDLWDVVMPRSQTGYATTPPTTAADRRHGNNWPLYQTEADLDRLRQRSRILTQTGGYGEGLLKNLVNYAVGAGGKYEILSKEKLPDADRSEPGTQLPDRLGQGVAAVQDFLDRWLERNGWNCCADPSGDTPISDSVETELCSRLYQDGEVFLRFYVDDDGWVCVRFVEPEQVINPPGATAADGWTWGIQHQMLPFEDVTKRLKYHIAWQDQTTAPHGDTVIGEVVDAKEILHIRAPGTRSTVKRGRPAFSFENAASLERASNLQRNASWGATIRAATAETWQHKIGTGDQISALESGLASRTRTNPLTGNTEFINDSRPGQRRRVPDGQELVPPAPDQTTSYLAGVQGDLRELATAFAAPEYLASGDASNNNFASIKEAGTPFARSTESVQSLLKSAFLRVVWKALRHAAARGVFPKQLLPLIDVQIELPQVVQRDGLQAAQEDQIAIQSGFDDPKSAALRRGYDWDTILANKQEHDELFGQQGEPLPMPGDDDGMGQPGAEPVPTGGSPHQAQAVRGNDLKTSVGGFNAITQLQTAYYAGEVPRQAAVANVVLLFGFSPQEAANLFPPVAPQKLTPDEPPAGPPGFPPGAGGGPPRPPTPPGGGGGEPPAPPFGESVREVKDDSGHQHGDDGKFTSGGGGAAKGDDDKGGSPHADLPGGSQLHDHAEAKAAEVQTKTKGLLAKLGAAGAYIKQKTKDVYNALERRYGRGQAIAIFAAGHVVGLATPLVVLPGSTLIGMAPFAAMSEIYLQAKKGLSKLRGKNEGVEEDEGEQLTPEQLKALGKELVEQLKAIWEKRPDAESAPE